MFHGDTAFSIGGHGGQLGMHHAADPDSLSTFKLARESEFHLLRHRLTVFVAQVAVGFHSQRTAVFVSKPVTGFLPHR